MRREYCTGFKCKLQLAHENWPIVVRDICVARQILYPQLLWFNFIILAWNFSTLPLLAANSVIKTLKADV